MYYLTKNFTWSSPFYVAANNLVSMRLRLGNDALKTYAVRLFGNPEVKFIGYGGKTESVLSYNYVDSSYIQMLFYYGSVAVILLVILYLVRFLGYLSTRKLFDFNFAIFDYLELYD